MSFATKTQIPSSFALPCDLRNSLVLGSEVRIDAQIQFQATFPWLPLSESKPAKGSNIKLNHIKTQKAPHEAESHAVLFFAHKRKTS